jgi:hypothetical protein
MKFSARSAATASQAASYLSALVSRWKGSRNGVLEALNDCSLSTAVCTNNDGHRKVEFNNLLLIVGREGTDASNGELVDGRHGGLIYLTSYRTGTGSILAICFSLL